MRQESVYSEVRNEYVDENDNIFIDAWNYKEDVDDDGHTVAVVIPPYYRNNVFYKNATAMEDPWVEETISEVVND